MIAIRVKEMFKEAGIEDVRPTDKALERMGMSRRRFTQLSENVNKTPVSVQELEAIKAWIANVKEVNPDDILGSTGSASDLKKRFNMIT